jgi:hypothetical protein
MDIAKLLERFDSKKLRPLTTIVIVEVMLFLFSIETLIEWFNIHQIVFFLFFVMASVLVFSIHQYIKQSPEQKSWCKAMFQWLVLVRTILAIIIFLLLFVLYVIFIVPDYRVIAITDLEDRQFETNKLLTDFTKQERLDTLSAEIQALLGDQYSVKIDDFVYKNKKNSRLIIVPGIFNKEKAVETLMKLEERIEFFINSDEEMEIPQLALLWKNKGCVKKNKLDIDKIKSQIGFMSGTNNNSKEISCFAQQWNKFKFIIK